MNNYVVGVGRCDERPIENVSLVLGCHSQFISQIADGKKTKVSLPITISSEMLEDILGVRLTLVKSGEKKATGLALFPVASEV